MSKKNKKIIILMYYSLNFKLFEPIKKGKRKNEVSGSLKFLFKTFSKIIKKYKKNKTFSRHF